MPDVVEPSSGEHRLAEVDALRRRILNVIPHALRTPITTLRGLAEAIPSASEADIRDHIAPALRRLAAQAEHLLDDMLIAADYTTALPTGGSVVEPVLATVGAVWDEVGAGADLAVDAEGSLRVAMPKGSLFKLLVHVLDNVAKYGDDPRRVAVRSEDGKVVLEVDAAGPACPDAAMYLEPFYRGEAAVLRSSGLGIGLTVARALAVQAGGDLTVEALPTGGLRTRIALMPA